MAINKNPPNLVENCERKLTPYKVKNKNQDSCISSWDTNNLEVLEI